MRFPRPYKLSEIAELIHAEPIGDPDFEVLGMNEIHGVSPGDIVFVDHPKYYAKALNSEATTILINKQVPVPEGKALLVSDNPFSDFSKLAEYFQPFIAFAKAKESTSRIGEGTIVQPNVHIGRNVTIGKDCIIHAGVVINDHTVIGDRVIIHSGTVLGADAFYYKMREQGYEKLQSCGRVVLQDDVELGALCTIDRGVTGDTIIGKGSKLDNQVHVAHDCVIGQHVLIASQVGIAGCTIIGDKVKIWGQVGITSGIHIANGTEILAQSGVNHDTEPGDRIFGSPAGKFRHKFRELAAVKQLPDLIKDIRS